jgi:3D (Asp-Asp-Asp) domain-containing protein
LWFWHSSVPAKGKKRKASVSSVPRDPSLVLVTGYCNCEKCCGWKKSWFGFGKPVYDYGPNKGRPKKVGVTASGIVASAGTVAADPKVFKFGTRLSIPGYGIGRVEDVGGAIKGRHIDLWFPSHKEALKWGRRWLKVVPVAGGENR